MVRVSKSILVSGKVRLSDVDCLWIVQQSTIAAPYIPLSQANHVHGSRGQKQIYCKRWFASGSGILMTRRGLQAKTGNVLLGNCLAFDVCLIYSVGSVECSLFGLWVSTLGLRQGARRCVFLLEPSRCTVREA